MITCTPKCLNQIGLILGLAGAILLTFSTKVGVLTKNGTVILHGLDPMDSPDLSAQRMLKSYWRNKFFTPAGWLILSLSFLLQFTATLG